LEHLLGLHRRYVNEFLARNDVDRARRHWELVHELPEQAQGEELAHALVAAVVRFRDLLATEYLTATHELLQHAAVPEGWRADYEKGLGALRRLLSLDRDNLRLLAALVEICVDWFVDCYNNEDGPQLCQQVDRYTPFALKLARLLADRPAELTARAALAEFYKFRGFIALDRSDKRALYLEALRFNPANDNVRELLADLERK
jgi:hypothetical protein